MARLSSERRLAPLPLTGEAGLGLFLALALLGCSSSGGEAPAPSTRPDAPQATATSTARAPSMAARPATSPAATITWEAPPSFTKVEHPSSMRKATYKLPQASGDTEAPELAVTVVGGSVDSNIERWIGQFDEGARETLNVHFMTPESERSTHYFWASTRGFRVDEPGLSEMLTAGVEMAFSSEDKPMIEAQQAMMGDSDFWSLNPVLLHGDAAAVMARRTLAALIEAERAVSG